MGVEVLGVQDGGPWTEDRKTGRYLALFTGGTPVPRKRFEYEDEDDENDPKVLKPPAACYVTLVSHS